MVTITPTAAKELKKVIKEEGKANAGVRVYLAGFSCSGAQYGLALEEGKGENDSVFESGGVKIFIDKAMEDIFKEAVIDYQNSEFGEGFVIQNVNLPNQGGCGGSCSGCG